jgi:5-methylcytosine-specific restriction endonuclease McrA
MQARIDARRGSAAARGLGSEWRKVRDAAVAEYRAAYGDWCPGMVEIGHSAHPSTDLTGDHIIARSRGGTNDQANVRVACRRANSAKGAGT